MTQQALAEKNVTFVFTDLGGGNMQFKMNSKLMPMNFTFRFGEEFMVQDPLLPGAMKVNN